MSAFLNISLPFPPLSLSLSDQERGKSMGEYDQAPPIAYPPPSAEKDNATYVTAAPPPMGYPSRDNAPQQDPAPTETTTRGAQSFCEGCSKVVDCCSIILPFCL